MENWYGLVHNTEQSAAALGSGTVTMKAEFTAIIEVAPEGGFWAWCPEIPGANGQGETVDEAKDSLKESIELILEDRRDDMLRGIPADTIRATVTIE